MTTARTITEGHWTYQRGPGAWDGWTVTDLRTGATHGRVLDTIVEARRYTYDVERAERPAVTMTIASGPQRARAGHQRFTAKHFA